MENIDEILKNANSIFENCKNLDAEIKEMNECKEFLLNEYKTNKRWFREDPGKVTVEDIIKASFEFGWSSHNNFIYRKD